MDYKKVTDGLAICTEDSCAMDACPYYAPGKYCINHLHDDALAMMKRLEPAKPVIIKAEFPYRKSVAYCGACGVRIRMAQNARDEYCWKCGRPVEWN